MEISSQKAEKVRRIINSAVLDKSSRIRKIYRRKIHSSFFEKSSLIPGNKGIKGHAPIMRGMQFGVNQSQHTHSEKFLIFALMSFSATSLTHFTFRSMSW